MVENTTHLAIQYWLYYVYIWHSLWPWHEHDWDSTVYIILQIFYVHSPVDLHVTDPQGRHVGIHYDTMQVEMEIPEAMYTSVEEGQIILVPNPIKGEYRVEIVGVETGTYNLTILQITDDKIIFKEELKDKRIEQDTVHTYLTETITYVKSEEPLWQRYWYVILATSLVAVLVAAWARMRERQPAKE